MARLRKLSVFLLFTSMLHQAPASLALGNKVLHIPEKIIGGVIDMVQSHKNKPSTQASFQQSVQTQTTFSQQGNPQGTAGNVQPPWTGPAYQGAGFQGQTQIQAQGQYGFGNQGTGNYQGAQAPVYPVNNGPAITGTPSGPFPGNPAPYPQQQGFSQSQNQGQYQNYQNQGQFQNQNQQGNFQGQNQNQGLNQNSQSGQYGSGYYQGTGQYAPGNGNYQYGGQSSSGNYQGSVGSSSSGNYQNVGPTSGSNYQNVGQGQGNYQGQTGNYQNTQTGQYQGTNGQFNQNNQGQYGQTGQNSSGQYQGANGQFSQNQQSQYGQAGQNGSGYYQGNQQTTSQSGQSSGSFGSSGFQTGSHQSGGGGNGCVCQTWTKPPGSQVLNDEPPKPDTVEKKPENIKPNATAML